MRIVHVASSINTAGGGTSEVIPRLAEEQCKLGHEVAICCMNTELSKAAQEAAASGVRILTFKSVGIESLGYSHEFNVALREQIEKASIVHLHGMWAWPCWAGGWLSQKLHRPYVKMPHGFLRPEPLKKSRLKKIIVGTLIERPLLRKAAAVIATSEGEVESLRAYGVQRPIYTMPIGIDLDRYVTSDCRTRTLLYLSRISPIKGLDLLAKAWGTMNRQNWRLLLVGPDDRGYTEVAKKTFAENCPVNSFEFREPVFGRDKYELLSSVGGFVLPSRSENWSISVAEAMASGLPVVCTQGAPWRCLEDIGAGWWVDVSVSGIRKGLEKLISLSEDERSKMGCRGRDWVGVNLNWRTIATDMVAYYEGLMTKVK